MRNYAVLQNRHILSLQSTTVLFKIKQSQKYSLQQAVVDSLLVLLPYLDTEADLDQASRLARPTMQNASSINKCNTKQKHTTHFNIPCNQWHSKIGAKPCARIPTHTGFVKAPPQQWAHLHSTPCTPYCYAVACNTV